MPECHRCGQCCNAANIILHSIKIDEDKQEFADWLIYHGMNVKRFPMDDGDAMQVRIPILCRHLTYGKDGKASCAIYEERPQICKDYKCPRTQEVKEE